MNCIGYYQSPFGRMLLSADGQGLNGIWFEGQKHFGRGLNAESEERELPLFARVREWLDAYFAGKEPSVSFPLHPLGSAFQKEIWELLCGIPYGTTVTYGALAAQLSERRGGARVSAQAVGVAVGRNPISILIPCHRVIGADGNLTGYAGGIDKKLALLRLEHVDVSDFFVSQGHK